MSQSINPNQIRPSDTDGDLMGTVNGSVTQKVKLVAGTGITITRSGSVYTVSATAAPPAFSITGFSGGSTVELGTSITNPTFTASYSATPASANITNTESIDSPHNLTTPFTSATISGTFVHSAVTTTAFTLSATQGTTATATQNITWVPRIFSGPGAAGATSSVTAVGTTAVLSTSDVLAGQLGAETVGEVFGPFTLSAQNIYLLLTGGSHTFVDNTTGFPFAFNSPTSVSFVNALGVTVSMFLYQSANPLTGTFSVRVAS